METFITVLKSAFKPALTTLIMRHIIYYRSSASKTLLTHFIQHISKGVHVLANNADPDQNHIRVSIILLVVQPFSNKITKYYH